MWSDAVYYMSKHLPEDIAGKYQSNQSGVGDEACNWADSPLNMTITLQLLKNPPDEKTILFELMSFVEFMMRETASNASRLWPFLLKALVNSGMRKSARFKAHKLIDGAVKIQKSRVKIRNDPIVMENNSNPQFRILDVPDPESRQHGRINEILAMYSRGEITASRAITRLCFLNTRIRWKQLREGLIFLNYALRWIGRNSYPMRHPRYRRRRMRRNNMGAIRRTIVMTTEVLLSTHKNPWALDWFVQQCSTTNTRSSVLDAVHAVLDDAYYLHCSATQVGVNDKYCKYVQQGHPERTSLYMSLR
jgi:hypothetical protein